MVPRGRNETWLQTEQGLLGLRKKYDTAVLQIAAVSNWPVRNRFNKFTKKALKQRSCVLQIGDGRCIHAAENVSAAN